MGKGYNQHQERVAALQDLGKDLARRAKSRCELTGEGGIPLRPYEVPPVGETPELETTLLISERCFAALERPASMVGREWQILAEIVWSENPAVQVVAWRMLNEIATREDWARNAIQDVFLDAEVDAWARNTRS